MPLAKLADLKRLINTTETSSDDVLTLMLQTATATAESLVGAADGTLQRSVDVVEWVVDDPALSRFVRLRRRPIEAVSEVRQFDTETLDSEVAATDPLVPNRDYVFDAELGKIERIGSIWNAGPRRLRVIYTAGFADPADVGLPGTAILPPRDLQHGVLQEALRLWQRRDMGGLTSLSVGSNGSAAIAIDKPHPDLVLATQSLRRWS